MISRIKKENILVVDDKKTKKLSGDEIRKILLKANYNVKEVVVSAPTVNEVNYVINYSINQYYYYYYYLYI